jgi:2,4-dienoyl-CoA reductase-like NADH-dependent reductase (Old Yellow Enzyme family)
MKVVNRFVKSAMAENMATRDGEITDDLIRMYSRWSKGGVGLIVTGNAYVSKGGNLSHLDIGAYDDRLIPGLRELAKAVHRFEGKIAVQLYHCGSQTFTPRNGKRPTSASERFAISCLRWSREMGEDEIYQVIDNFGNAAVRVKQAGIDAVQIHAAHGWLINQFLARSHNRRKDKWGGSLENRMRLLVEIYKDIRKKVGDTYPVMMKLNAVDGIRKGLDIDEAKVVVRKMSDLGIDAIEISGGIGESYTGFYTVRGDLPEKYMKKMMKKQGAIHGIVSKFTRPYISLIKEKVKLEEGYFIDLAREVRKVTEVPLMIVGGIRTKKMMESIIVDDGIEFVSLARPLVIEPNLPNKMKEGSVAKASCPSCNSCYGAVGCDMPLKCYYNKR